MKLKVWLDHRTACKPDMAHQAQSVIATVNEFENILFQHREKEDGQTSPARWSTTILVQPDSLVRKAIFIHLHILRIIEKRELNI